MRVLSQSVSYFFLGLLVSLQICDTYTMEVFSKETALKIQFSDQSEDEFSKVNKDLVMQFNTIATMIEDVGEQDVLIPIQGVTSNIWFTIELLLSEKQTRDVEVFQGLTITHLKEICKALNYLDPKESTKAKQVFDTAIQEYAKRLVEKDQLIEEDFFGVGLEALDKILVDVLVQQLIKPDIPTNIIPIESVSYPEQVYNYVLGRKISFYTTPISGKVISEGFSNVDVKSVLSPDKKIYITKSVNKISLYNGHKGPLIKTISIPSLKHNFIGVSFDNGDIFLLMKKIHEVSAYDEYNWFNIFMSGELDLLIFLNSASKIQNIQESIPIIIALFNMIKDPSQRTEENYNKFPKNIREAIKKLFPQGIWKKYVAPWLG